MIPKNHLARSSDCTLGEYLSTIRQTSIQLQAARTDKATTAAALASRIELWDVLLGAIHDVRNGLTKDLQRTRGLDRAERQSAESPMEKSPEAL
jgi:hypothetical protein